MQANKVCKTMAIILCVIFMTSVASAELKLESVSKTLGVVEQDLENVTLKGTGFDQNTKVLMFPDVWNKRKVVGSVKMSDYAAVGIAMSGSIAFVVNGNGLQIVDVSDPEYPVIIKSVDTGYANGVAVSGNFAFVAAQSAGLQIVDVSEPANAGIINFVNMQGYARKIAILGNIAFVAAGTGGLQIADMTDIQNPVIKSVDTPKPAMDVAVSGDTVFVACGSYDGEGNFVGNGSLEIVDMSDPGNPYIVRSVELPDSASGLAVSGSTVYVADLKMDYKLWM